MTLNVSLDGGSTWSVCTKGLIDFEQYPALLLRFVDTANEEELPSWIAPRMPDPKECADLRLEASIHDAEANVDSHGNMEC